MWTDSGWYWVSDEQWAWATYHYGRWAYDSYYGWVWVPDTEWGPSWVSWRQGGEYVGWAPLPPGAGFGPEGRFVVRDHPIQDRFFVFVGIGHFSEPVHRRSVIVNKTTVINQTVNITNITRVNNVVVNHGPKFESMQKVSTRKLTEPPPHVVSPKTFKPTPGEQTHERLNEPKTKGHEPEIIRGSPGTPQEASPLAGEHGKKSAEKPRVEPQPTESKLPPGEKPEHSQKDKDRTNPYDTPRPGKSFDAKPVKPYAPVEPDSVQPRQHTNPNQPPPGQPKHEDRAAEKKSQPREEKARDEKPGKEKGDRSGD